MNLPVVAADVRRRSALRPTRFRLLTSAATVLAFKTLTWVGRTLALCLIWGGSVWGGSELSQQMPAPLRSLSGQFMVVDLRVSGGSAPPGRAAPELLELSPPFLVVSCERIKQALYDDLGLGRDWRGNIRVALRSWSPGATASIRVERFGASWIYQLDLPEWIDRGQFARTLVQGLLLELANRTATERSAEIPLWLSEGLTQRLLAAREVELILPPPHLNIRGLTLGPTLLQQRDPDPLESVRRQLQDRPALSIMDLSWPEPEKFTPAEADFFQGNAQLFVTELRLIRNGPVHLRQFVAALPQFYNWQAAFWRAYDPHFPNQLALEKWWALQTTHFAGRDHRQLWSGSESAHQLEAVLQTTVAVRTSPRELPVRTQVSLATVIAEWDTVRQMATLPGKIRDLEQIQTRVAPEYMILVHDYRRWMDDYVKKRNRFPATFAAGRDLPPGLQKLMQETLAQLQQLEARRQTLATAPTATETAIATESRPGN
jgi:hypothetical protein